MRLADNEKALLSVLSQTDEPSPCATASSFVQHATAAVSEACNTLHFRSPVSPVDLATAYVASPQKKAYRGTANVDSLSDEQLRFEFRLRWKGSQREFCREFPIHEGNFSSWLNHRLQSQPASSAAVRRWLSSLDSPLPSSVTDTKRKVLDVIDLKAVPTTTTTSTAKKLEK